MVGPARPQFVLFGSSIVQLSFSHGGWGAILSNLYARKVLDQVFPKDAAVQPSLVIVYFGGNDSMGPHPSGLGPHVPLSEFIENMRKIASHIQSLSDSTRIIVLSCPPVNEATIIANKRDGIHLSAEGSKIVAEEILKVLREADWKPSLHWKSMPTEFAEDSPSDLVAADGKTTLNPSEWTFYRDSHWNSL
ncbi:hypothetical protein ACLB2K_076091 [Fragaria x ananassa]